MAVILTFGKENVAVRLTFGKENVAVMLAALQWEHLFMHRTNKMSKSIEFFCCRPYVLLEKIRNRGGGEVCGLGMQKGEEW